MDRFAIEVGVIGFEMSHKDGRAVLEALRGRPDGPRIVIHTGADEATVPSQVMALGGAGFLAKREPPERLLETILAVAGGRRVFPFVDVRRLGEDSLAV